VQPLDTSPFTGIGPDSRWTNSTHLGTEYAALLVDPGYFQPARTDRLPAVGGGVVTLSVVDGSRFWTEPWFCWRS
jgi:hypothetical protein